jgi:hypothetical protein
MHPARVRRRASLATPKGLQQRPWGAIPLVGWLTRGAVPALLGALWLLWVPGNAQLTDITQTPNAEDAGIQKSLEEQVGGGRGDMMTSDSLALYYRARSVPGHSAGTPGVPAQVHDGPRSGAACQ